MEDIVLDEKVNLEEIINIVTEKMHITRWYDNPDYFISEREFSMIVPNSTISLFEHGTNIRCSFKVFQLENLGEYRRENKENIRLSTAFELSVDTNRLSLDTWYDLYFTENNNSKDCSYITTVNNKQSLLIIRKDNDWAIGISTLDSSNNLALQYIAKKLDSNKGFTFKINSRDIGKIWFRVCWIGLDKVNQEEAFSLIEYCIA